MKLKLVKHNGQWYRQLEPQECPQEGDWLAYGRQKARGEQWSMLAPVWRNNKFRAGYWTPYRFFRRLDPLIREMLKAKARRK